MARAHSCRATDFEQCQHIYNSQGQIVALTSGKSLEDVLSCSLFAWADRGRGVLLVQNPEHGVRGFRNESSGFGFSGFGV